MNGAFILADPNVDQIHVRWQKMDFKAELKLKPHRGPCFMGRLGRAVRCGRGVWQSVLRLLQPDCSLWLWRAWCISHAARRSRAAILFSRHKFWRRRWPVVPDRPRGYGQWARAGREGVGARENRGSGGGPGCRDELGER